MIKTPAREMVAAVPRAMMRATTRRLKERAKSLTMRRTGED
jgi:hypothetical protein